MTAREQTGDSELYRLVLAYNDFTNLLRESLDVLGHAGMICGNNVFRKHDGGQWVLAVFTSTDTLVRSVNLAS
jgi:hypothetical protein